MEIKYPYNSLEDFLISTELTVDGQLNDGWGAMFPVKGREIKASILFCDISRFTARTQDLSPAETLIFVNNFFAWISAEALRGGNGVVDKYIGDEVMIVFSTEFGSEDPFVDAVQAARWMAEHDVWSFSPHIGIASGEVIVGYVGTPKKFNCSVFGLPVALAARCAGIKPDKKVFSTASIAFPASEWGGRDFGSVFPPKKIEDFEGNITEQPHSWVIQQPKTVPVKNLPDLEVIEIIKGSFHMPTQSAEERARESLSALKSMGRYWPRND
ncbi:MAG: adenylate/guanylate cyclase domain-containing protein [Candidatus Thorarchaeota archaeon]|jgi:class 3 adenylate cyclase